MNEQSKVCVAGVLVAVTSLWNELLQHVLNINSWRCNRWRHYCCFDAAAVQEQQKCASYHHLQQQQQQQEVFLAEKAAVFSLQSDAPLPRRYVRHTTTAASNPTSKATRVPAAGVTHEASSHLFVASLRLKKSHSEQSGSTQRLVEGEYF